MADKWEKARLVRRVVTGALEIERREKRIGSSLQAAPVVHLPADDMAVLEGLDLAELAITSVERSPATATMALWRGPSKRVRM